MMRRGILAFGMLWVSTLAWGAPSTVKDRQPRHRFDFDHDPTGEAPKGVSFARTGGGAGGTWCIRQIADAPVGAKGLFRESDDATRSRFPLALVVDLEAADVDVSVRFRTQAGRVDQAAGLVWRYRNSRNYYLTRANALEGNVVAYKVEDDTFKGPGRVGLWTKADSVTGFDDLEVEVLDSP